FCFVFFFFSSRRRHTRSKRDWSSDVCSSDLMVQYFSQLQRSSGMSHCTQTVGPSISALKKTVPERSRARQGQGGSWMASGASVRSEERRVGKEWRDRRALERGERCVERRRRE